ncbi:MAG: hypothetical protein ABSH47_08895 [Bryobacteraceae bacterium]|jgi:hypothetical protein
MFYLRKRTAYVPTMARTQAGFWLSVEPVDVAPVADAEALKLVLLRAIERGNPVVPTPGRDHFPPDVMRRYCGMRSLSAFERTAQLWSFGQSADTYLISQWRRSEVHRGAWEQSLERTTVLAAMNVEEAVRRVADLAFAGPA